LGGRAGVWGCGRAQRRAESKWAVLINAGTASKVDRNGGKSWKPAYRPEDVKLGITSDCKHQSAHGKHGHQADHIPRCVRGIKELETAWESVTNRKKSCRTVPNGTPSFHVTNPIGAELNILRWWSEVDGGNAAATAAAAAAAAARPWAGVTPSRLPPTSLEKPRTAGPRPGRL